MATIDSPVKVSDHSEHFNHCACGAAGGALIARVTERRFGLPGIFDLVRCASCGLVRTAPQPGDPGTYYPSGAYYAYRAPERPGSRIRTLVHGAYHERGLRRAACLALASRLCQGLPPGPPTRILDVGCGSGAFLLALSEAGWDVHGVELDAGAVRAANEAGLTGVRAGDLLEQAYDAQEFGAVRFWHSLEHVPSPAMQIEEAHRLLKPGGSLTIGVPNYGSLLAQRTGERWFGLDVPRHLWHFTPGSLREVVECSGFEVTSVRVESTPTTLLGTVDALRGGGERLVASRRAWYAALPLSVALDLFRAGDAIRLTAVKRS